MHNHTSAWANVIPRLGISACLLGQNVRYDGRHKKHPFLIDTLTPYVEWVAMCPEAGAGMGVPREPVRLQRSASSVEMVGWETESVYTDALQQWSEGQLTQWQTQPVHGVILKSKSPSCGLGGIDIYEEKQVVDVGRGLFVEALLQRMPWLPAIDETSFERADTKRHFLTQLYAYARWFSWQSSGQSAAGLQRFHATHKMLFLAYDQSRYRKMGPLVAQWKSVGIEETCVRYRTLMDEALRTPPKDGDHVNVILHLLGVMKPLMSDEQKADLYGHLDRFKRGELAVEGMVGQLERAVASMDAPAWLQEQCYLRPHPVVPSDHSSK